MHRRVCAAQVRNQLRRAGRTASDNGVVGRGSLDVLAHIGLADSRGILDGFNLVGSGDCDDEDSSVFPGAEETPYDSQQYANVQVALEAALTAIGTFYNSADSGLNADNVKFL